MTTLKIAYSDFVLLIKKGGFRISDCGLPSLILINISNKKSGVNKKPSLAINFLLYDARHS